MTVNTLVDTGAYTWCINENIQEQLKLPLLERRVGNRADGCIKEYDAAGPVELKFKNRSAIKTQWYCRAIKKFCRVPSHKAI